MSYMILFILSQCLSTVHFARASFADANSQCSDLIDNFAEMRNRSSNTNLPPAVFTPSVTSPAVVGALGLIGISSRSEGVLACFSADTMVTTDSGEKRMDELRIDDLVLSTTSHGRQLVYVPVTTFLHRIPHTKTKFLRLETADGSVIKITEQHFIYRKERNTMNGDFVWAQDVEVGDSLMRIVGNEILPTKVTSVTVIEEIGAFAPMTSNGLIIVNDLVASCHSVSRAQCLQHTFFHWIRTIESLFKQLFGNQWFDNSDGFVDVPTGTWKILSVLEHLIPS